METKEIIIAVGSILIGAFLSGVPLWRKLAKQTKTMIDDRVLEIAISVVGFVKSTFVDSSNESKKQRAMDLVTEQLAKEGIKGVASATIDGAIEKAVTKMKVADLGNEAVNQGTSQEKK